jgi:hypothetical protein
MACAQMPAKRLETSGSQTESERAKKVLERKIQEVEKFNHKRL